MTQRSEHLDLVRNDYEKEVQVRVAHVFLGPGTGTGLVIQQDANGGEWERLIREAVPDAFEASERIAERLAEHFHGPYLFVTGPHSDEECPFAAGPVQMSRKDVAGEYHLPRRAG